MSAVIKRCLLSDAGEIRRLYDSESISDDFLYLPISESEAADLFINDAAGVKKTVLGAFEGGELIGFAAGCVKDGKAFVTMLAVAADRRLSGVGSSLLSEIERELGTGSCEMSFYDPTQLPWAVPGTDGKAMHNNSPGVDMSSPAYGFFSQRGYRTYAVEYSYYMPLGGYIPPEKITAIRERLAGEGITVGFYDPSLHHGFDYVCDSTGFTGWKDAVAAELKKTDPRPVLCVFDGGRVIGSVGYISAPRGGRGFFLGVGVAPEYRRRGVGKLMFSSLCSELQRLGAGYMTLFTGEDNMSARSIYESAGFVHVRSWALMRKP